MGRSSASNANKKPNLQKVLLGRSSFQILSELCSLSLSAYVQDGSIWIAVPEQVAATLHEYAVGSSDGGPTTALHTAAKLSQLTETCPTVSEVWILTDHPGA